MKKEKRRVTVKLNRKNWKVESGSCTCPAGNSANCNHVLGLLFEIADYFFTLYDPWKTQALSIEKLSKMQSELQNTAQKMKFSIKDFFSKCDQICRKLQIRSHLLKRSLIENFIFCAVKHKHGYWIFKFIPPVRNTTKMQNTMQG